MPAQRPAAPPSRIGQVRLGIEKDRAWDVGGPEGVASLPDRIQVPAHVDHAKSWLAETFGEPVRGDERAHYFAIFA